MNGYNNQGYQSSANANANSQNVSQCMYWPGGPQGPAPQIKSRSNTGRRQFNAATPIDFNACSGVFPGQPLDISNSPHSFTFGPNSFGQGEPMMQTQRSPVKAYFSPDGQPGSKANVQIPCHMGNSPGEIPQMPTMPPMGYRVQIPPVAPSPPVDFEVSQ